MSAVDRQSPFVGLLGEHPLLLSLVVLRQIVQQPAISVAGACAVSRMSSARLYRSFAPPHFPADAGAGPAPTTPDRTPGRPRRIRVAPDARRPAAAPRRPANSALEEHAAQLQQRIDVRFVPRLLLQNQRLAQDRHSILILSEAVVHLAHGRQQSRLGRRLIPERIAQPFGARIQQFPGGDLIAAVHLGIRELEQIDQRTSIPPRPVPARARRPRAARRRDRAQPAMRTDCT